jgi:hypothetical protein
MFDIEQIKKAMPEATFELFTEGFSDIDYMSNWTLVGGTALSIHLQHRLSEDLDFFIEKSTLDQERTHIEKMIRELEDKGYDCVCTHNNSENLDYEIEGVKVTFFASGLKNLKSNCGSYKKINIASLETIIVMKMEAIIHYRTKTRDFYDIYIISEQEDISIFTMLDIYNDHSLKKGKEELLYTRFITNPLNSDDEGLSGMSIKKRRMSNFQKLREWIIDEVKTNKVTEEKIILSILENPLLIEKYKDFNFGFERLSLPQKLASIGQSDMLIKCLELNIFDITYEAISGKNLLDYYLLEEDNDIFKKILKYSREIPSKWLESKTYKREGKLEAIQYENSILYSIENNQTNERMKIVSEKFGISFDEYLKRVEEKKKLLANFSKVLT